MLYSFSVLLVLGLGLVHAIYPSDHFDYSTKLTSNNFDDHVRSVVDSGKTLMVRWIASPG